MTGVTSRTWRRRARITSQRRGMVLVAAMVCVLIATMVAGTLARTVVLERRLARSRQHHLQAEFLADAGLDRALAALDRSVDYGGEEWIVPAEEIDGEHEARVQIRVDTNQDSWSVTAVAVFPRDATRRATVTRHFQTTAD